MEKINPLIDFPIILATIFVAIHAIKTIIALKREDEESLKPNIKSLKFSMLLLAVLTIAKMFFGTIEKSAIDAIKNIETPKKENARKIQ